ncbi:probable multidrug resistance-associated protein lethal(2)03659 isoform X1 [Neodiprion fabricii]|uniref:probable multidrug resistance-associated protein lethal(2)03659 isoform X1 n=2 Tax=Neodiprion fabricii TaxID=2872261 RepID=UPI001ED8CC63|nr:probable multidrug resistance-associated protein lethal(2)03659 isoform X1 [Neodiprion fabricii]
MLNLRLLSNQPGGYNTLTDVMDGREQQEKVKNPRAKANCLSALTFSWILGTFWLGYKRDLEVEDLYTPLKEHTSGLLGEKITKTWENEIQRLTAKRDSKKSKAKGPKEDEDEDEPVHPSLLRVLIKVFGAETLFYGVVLAVLEITMRVVQPLFLGRLLRYFSTTDGSDVSTLEAYLYGLGVVVCSGANIFILHPYMMAILHMGMKIRVACCTLIYRKALRLSKTALGETTIGQAVNLLSNDVNRFDVAIVFLNYIWIAPLETIIISYFMWAEVGVSAIIGVATLLMFIPLQGYLAKRSSVLRLRTALKTDERVRLTNEIISGIQAIKMYTWEKPFGDLIQKARKREIKEIRLMSYIRGITMSFIIFNTRLSLFITIVAYILMENNITAEKVFMLTAYYNILRQTMTVYFPQGVTQTAEVMVSVKRLQTFMRYDEAVVVKNPQSTDKSDEHGQGSIKIDNVSAKWVENSSENTLVNLNINVKPGQLVAIVGQVGSGKTSLLHTILRELPLSSGTVKVNGSVAYASQEPWLFGGSVRQNILFGRKMDPRRYDKVVKVCQLKRDFTLFPYGDKTVVGERGVSLSGGQRARINLARAVYANVDIYLMDDPLSAVDAHVGKHMFDECVDGYLKEKTRIIVTHQLQYLKHVDQIIVLKDGAIWGQGTYQELQKLGLDFGQVLEPPEENKPEQRPLSRLISRHSSISSVDSIGMGDMIEQEAPLEEAEVRSSGTVDGKVYAAYLNSAGNWCAISAILFLFSLSQVFASGGDYFLSTWVNLEEANAGLMDWDSWLSRDICIYIYTFLVVGTVVLTLLRSFSFYGMAMRASKRLHDRMFRGISRATMRFFNMNSSGRILNRFSKDMGAVDELLPTAMIDCVQIGLGLIGVIVVVAIANPWLMIPTVVIGFIFYLFRIIYMSTSRSVKRLEGVTRSPVFAHLNATLQGLTTIRAFQAGETLTAEFDHHQDLHSSAWFIFIASARAFGFWLDIVCVIYIALVVFSFLVLPDMQGSAGGSVGLAITQSIGLTGMFQWGMRQSAELENQMTSVERICEYSVVDQEPPLESTPENKPDPKWPAHGKVEFKKLSMRYGPEEPDVLKDLDFVVLSREKIGIVGRTGAGKSSLVSALFRLAYIDGDIVIDSVESSKLGLHDLRSKISIIPQEPFLFSGSLRRNLDPFDEYPDSALWQALEEVELKEMGLESNIAEGGSNLSVGQRQLVCLARAIIRNNPVLILDEATANVDPRTDELIQKTIRIKFANCTVLTIAHRLNTVMDSNKVLVMDAGFVVEYDHPHVLLQKENGYLRSMVDQTGKSMADTLTVVAQKNYDSSFA